MKKLILFAVILSLVLLVGCVQKQDSDKIEKAISKQEAENISYNFMKELSEGSPDAEKISVIESYKEGDYWKVKIDIDTDIVWHEINTKTGEVEYIINARGERLAADEALNLVKN